MPTATAADGTTLHYTDRGSGRALLFVHGTFVSGEVWAHQRPAFEAYRTLTLDLRGHGDSDTAEDYSLSAYASDVAAVLDDAGVETATLVGWSHGAKTCARFAAEHPDRVSACALVSSNMFHRTAPSGVREERDHVDYDAFIDDLRRDWPGTIREFVDGLFAPSVGEATRNWLADIALSFPLHAVLTHYRDMAPVTGDDHRRDLESLASAGIPTLVCHGAHDTAATLAEARAAAERAGGNFVPFEASGHCPFLAEVERFNDVLASFLG